jgi:hypothetical protein
MRLILHPAGMGPRVVNYAAWRAHALAVLRQQVEARADPVIEDLLAEIAAYPAPLDLEPYESFEASQRLATPLCIATRHGIVSFLNTVTVFGTANDVTLAELALEMLFPADDQTIHIVDRMVREVRLAEESGSALAPARPQHDH